MNSLLRPTWHHLRLNMRRWRSTAWSVAAAAITLSSAALPTSGYQSAYREDAETSTAPYRVYALERVTPSDAKRMFLDLHGELPRDARILADDERGELIVTGPDSVQRLAQQLVAQLNAGNQTRSSQAPARIVRTYEVQSSQLSLIQDQLTNQLSSSARIAVDSSNQRIVIAGSAQDHALAERLLRSQTVARPTQLEQARSDSPFAEPSLPLTRHSRMRHQLSTGRQRSLNRTIHSMPSDSGFETSPQLRRQPLFASC